MARVRIKHTNPKPGIDWSHVADRAFCAPASGLGSDKIWIANRVFDQAMCATEPQTITNPTDYRWRIIPASELEFYDS